MIRLRNHKMFNHKKFLEEYIRIFFTPTICVEQCTYIWSIHSYRNEIEKIRFLIEKHIKKKTTISISNWPIKCDKNIPVKNK